MSPSLFDGKTLKEEVDARKNRTELPMLQRWARVPCDTLSCVVLALHAIGSSAALAQ
jgi:hypothetical protein